MNRWSDQDAADYVRRYASHDEDLALRVYTSRLIGQDSTYDSTNNLKFNNCSVDPFVIRSRIWLSAPLSF